MTSTDIISIANSEQEFRVYVITKLDAHDKRLDGIDKRLDGIDKRLDNVESEQKAQREELVSLRKDMTAQTAILQDMHEQLMIQNARLASMEYWGGIGFTILAAIIAFVGVFAPRFWTPAREADATPRRPLISIDDMKDLLALIRTDSHNNPAP